MRVWSVAALACAVALAGCGESGSHWSSAACRREAGWIAERADAMVRLYGGVSVYPADVSYLGFRGSLDRFESGRCPSRVLARALQRALTPRGRETLVDLLPADNARLVREALGGS